MTVAAITPGGIGALLLASSLCLVPGVAGAQVNEMPLIELPSGAGEPLADASPNSGAQPAPVDDGLIRLPPPGAGAAEPEAGLAAENPADDPAGAMDPLAASVERDRGEGDATASAGWLIRPQPLDLLPEGVQAGASLSAPGILRLTGENARVGLVIDLLPVSPMPDALQLTLHSSVNVLPERAVIQVAVNDAAPVSLPLDRLGDFSTLTVPTDALRPGSNRIALTLHQPHRIFCGPEATFGVWTEIDLGQSGVFLPDAALKADAAGFAMAARSETAGGRNLVLLAEENTDPALIRRLSAQLSRALGPGGRVGVRSFYSLGEEPIASVALIASDAARAEVRQRAGRGLVLQVEYHDGILPDLTPFLAAFPPAPPVVATLIEPGVRTPLSGLGSGDIIGNTHYFRRDIPFTLPADWLLMANQKARLDLHYGFARGLPAGAIMLVKINNETIRLLPLDEKGGEVLPELPVGFNANMLHPGRNLLSFEMMVPGSPPEGACPIRRADLLAVLSDTSLTIPPSPSMVLPGLATALLRLDPAAVIAPEGAAEYAKLAAEAMQIGAELAPPAQSQENIRLQVVGLSDFGLVPFDGSGLSLSTVQSVLFPRAIRPEPVAGSTGGAPAEPARQAFTLSEDAAPAAAAPVDEPGFASGFVRDLWQSLSPAALISREYGVLRDSSFVGTSQSLTDWLQGRSGTALLLRPDFTQPDDLWLMLGPGAAPAGVGKALNRLREDSLAQGEAALLQADGSWQVWTPIRPPRLLTLPDAGSLRTVLGNYASWSPLIFTLLTLGLALLSALPALLYVLLSRKKGMGE